MPVVRPDLDKSSLLRKLVLCGFTHIDGLHQRCYGLLHFRVLTVVPTRQRIGTILAAHQQLTDKLVRPGSVYSPIGAAFSTPRTSLPTRGSMSAGGHTSSLIEASLGLSRTVVGKVRRIMVPRRLGWARGAR